MALHFETVQHQCTHRPLKKAASIAVSEPAGFVLFAAQ